MLSSKFFVILAALAVASALPYPQPTPPILEEEDNPSSLNSTVDFEAEEFISEEFTRIRPGYDLFGDIILPEGFFTEGATFTQLAKRWPGGQVPYVIDGTLSKYKTLILNGMKEYHDKTCVKFIPRTTHKDYVLLYAGSGCNSYLGVVGGRQILNLQAGACTYLGTVIHELGHALGLHHEHQRSDRDGWINVFMNNVQAGADSQFTRLKANENTLVTGYDTDSIMHYGENAFSKDGTSKTMTAKDKNKKLLNPYDKKVLTPSDVRTVKWLYGCR